MKNCWRLVTLGLLHFELGARMPSAFGEDLAASPGGFVRVPRTAQFVTGVAADLPAATADFMAASQSDTAGASFGIKLPAVAWRDKPVYGIVAIDDKSMSSELERFIYREPEQ